MSFFTNLTKYETSHVIGVRAEQLVRGGQPMVDIDENNFDPIEVARRELASGRMPFTVIRTLPNGTKERMSLS